MLAHQKLCFCLWFSRGFLIILCLVVSAIRCMFVWFCVFPFSILQSPSFKEQADFVALLQERILQFRSRVLMSHTHNQSFGSRISKSTQHIAIQRVGCIWKPYPCNPTHKKVPQRRVIDSHNGEFWSVWSRGRSGYWYLLPEWSAPTAFCRCFCSHNILYQRCLSVHSPPIAGSPPVESNLCFGKLSRKPCLVTSPFSDHLLESSNCWLLLGFTHFYPSSWLFFCVVIPSHIFSSTMTRHHSPALNEHGGPNGW